MGGGGHGPRGGAVGDGEVGQHALGVELRVGGRAYDETGKL